MRIEDYLPSSDLERLNDIVPVFESSGRDFLSNDFANLVEPRDDCTIPEEAWMHSISGVASPLHRALPRSREHREVMEMFKRELLGNYAAENKKKKFSTTLSDYLWPSDEGDTQVEFRSPVPEFPPPGQLRILLSNTSAASRRRKRKAYGEYCLSACDDGTTGTVKWIHESECESQNHVWTVRLFERRGEGVLHLRDELRRPEPNVYKNCAFNKYNNYIGRSLVMRIEDHLPSSDLERLNDIDTVFESSERDYLSNDCANLVEQRDDRTIPEEARFSMIAEIAREVIVKVRLAYVEKYIAVNNMKKLSKTLLDYLWPSDKGDTRVQFRSPVPEFPPPGELRVLLSNTRASRLRKRKVDGEYCLSACDGGTVKWLHESECVSQNHVWKVLLVERRGEGVLRLRDELRSPEPNVYNPCVINNNYIGGNVNGSGKQIIGEVSQSVAVECQLDNPRWWSRPRSYVSWILILITSLVLAR